MSNKILYNVTVKIVNDKAEDWIQWMSETHIPDVIKTGKFLSYRMTEIYDDESDDGRSFAIQYVAKDMETFQDYQTHHAKALQQDHATRYADQYVAFRTLMQIIKES